MTYYELNDNKEPLADLRNDNRNPEVQEKYAVPSDSRDSIGHVIRKVTHLSKPLEKADATEDSAVTWLCSCEDTKYNRWGTDGTVPDDYTPCKHITENFKSARATEDKSQTELTFDERTPVGNK